VKNRRLAGKFQLSFGVKALIVLIADYFGTTNATELGSLYGHFNRITRPFTVADFVEKTINAFRH
jgi:hypothetical protein